MVLVAPSILSADFSQLGQEVRSLEKAGADLIHIDVMDGHFVPNLTFGAGVVRDIRKCTDLPFDVHLMMTNPANFISDFAKAGADTITIHLECEQNIADLISLISAYIICESPNKSVVLCTMTLCFLPCRPVGAVYSIILAINIFPATPGAMIKFFGDQITTARANVSESRS